MPPRAICPGTFRSQLPSPSSCASAVPGHSDWQRRRGSGLAELALSYDALVPVLVVPDPILRLSSLVRKQTLDRILPASNVHVHRSGQERDHLTDCELVLALGHGALPHDRCRSGP
jgi:hypothetical protein